MAKKTKVKRKKKQTQKVPAFEVIVEQVNPQDIIIKPDQLKKTLEETENELERLQIELSKDKSNIIKTVSKLRSELNDNRRSNRDKDGVKTAISAARIARSELNKEERDLQHKLEGEIRKLKSNINVTKKSFRKKCIGYKKTQKAQK